MRIAVVSDIHGNMTALRAVSEDWLRCGVDAVLCLGDSVGYGPEPEEVIGFLSDQRIPWIMGNHELGMVNPAVLAWFNSTARASLVLTRRLLSERSVAIIKALERCLCFEGARCVHGCPPCSPTRYLFSVSLSRLRRIMEKLPERICFVGHTHLLEMIRFDEDPCRRPLGRGRYPLPEECRHVINVGSVGQPRDGDERAKYVIWDKGGRFLEVRFVPYDVEDTVRKILNSGLPEINAWRLRGDRFQVDGRRASENACPQGTFLLT